MNAQVQRTWWQRNWKWVVATAAIAAFLLFALFVGGVLWLARAAMQNNDVHRTAMERVSRSAEATALLGEPIEAGFLSSGSIKVDGRSGDADLAIPVSGPRGEGTVSVIARKKGGAWYFDELEFRPAGGDAIDLRSQEQIRDAEGSR
jgi:hypothetical protein